MGIAESIAKTSSARGALYALLAAALAFAPAVQAAAVDATTEHHRASSSKPFDDVLIDLEFAITDHNYRLTSRNGIGAAIAERNGRPFPRSSVLHFCNLEDARKILEAAPDYLVHMPCRIVLYEQGGRTIVETRLLPEDDARVNSLSIRINNLLKAIIAYGVE